MHSAYTKSNRARVIQATSSSFAKQGHGMEKRMTVGPWHWGNDSPGTPSLEALSITGEKPQNWVTSKVTGLAPKDKQVPAHPPGPLNSIPGVRCM